MRTKFTSGKTFCLFSNKLSNELIRYVPMQKQRVLGDRSNAF